MEMRDAGGRWLESTRGRIVGLLRRKGRTVSELAGILELTDNAVRAHLTALERDGLVRQSGYLKGPRKPFQFYALTNEAEQLFPKGYGMLLRQVLTTLVERDGQPRVEELLRDVGRRLAQGHAERLRSLPLEQRLEEAVAILAELGGLAEVEVEDGTAFLQGYSCPFAEVLPDRPEVCSMAETFLSEVLGCEVVDMCSKGGEGEPPRCRFRVGGSLAASGH